MICYYAKSWLTSEILQKFTQGTPVQGLVASIKFSKCLFKQAGPELDVAVCVHLDELAIQSWKSIIHDDIVPLAVLPNSKMKYSYAIQCDNVALFIFIQTPILPA